MSSIITRVCDAIVAVIGSIFSEEDKGKGLKYPTTHPLTQADLVGWYTIGTILSYSAFLLIVGDKYHMPPIKFYVIWIALYLLFWGSMYVEYIPVAFNKWNSGIDEFSRTINGKESRKRYPIKKWRPPRIEQHTNEFHYPKGVAIRVFLLVTTSIIFSCWFTLYSGGPFQSAYSQVIIAYPLFATNVARNPKSLLAVYFGAIFWMVMFETIKHYYVVGHTTQNFWWYIIVSVIVIAMSGLIAAANRKYEREEIENSPREESMHLS